MSDEETTKVQSITAALGASEPGKSAFLLVVSTKQEASTGRMFKLERPESVIGRSVEADIHLVDDGISRKHARLLKKRNGNYEVHDLGSTNGTFLNGERIQGSMPLKDGDKIQIGSTTVLLFSLQDQLEEQFQKSIYESATRDSLTRVYNKKYLLDLLRKEHAYCIRHNVPLSLVMIDVDHFKKVNDTHGHPAGDQVLIKLTEEVGKVIRAEDTLARFGGEEFALLLREAGVEQAHACAERCRRSIESSPVQTRAGAVIRVTISCGVSTMTSGQYAAAEDMIAAADQLLYRAKQAGRNRVESQLTR